LIFLLLPSEVAGYHGDPRVLWRITTYVSLLTNLIVSPTLIIHILRSKKELDSVLSDTRTNQSPYKRIIEILIEAAFPPLPAGIVHIILFAAFKTQAIVLNMILLSFTVCNTAAVSCKLTLTGPIFNLDQVLAPQTIALRVMQERQHQPSPVTMGDIPTLPIAFAVGQSSVASHTRTPSDHSLTGSDPAP
jgi:hypothetical protein